MGALRLALAALALALLAPIASSAAPLPSCDTPVVVAEPAYTQGADNTIAWTAGVSGGSIAQASADGIQNPDGSFVTVAQGFGSNDPGVSTYTFVGLAEGPTYFNVRAKTKPQTCGASAWSNVVSSIQDSTGPVATITVPTEGEIVVSLTGLTVAGTLTDPDAGSAPGSGPASVTITLTNTTPAIGDVVGAPASVTEDASDGSYSHTFSDLVAGTYTATVVGTDVVGNVGGAATVNFIAVSIA